MSSAVKRERDDGRDPSGQPHKQAAVANANPSPQELGFSLLRAVGSNTVESKNERITLSSNPNTDFSVVVQGTTQNVFHLCAAKADPSPLEDIQEGLNKLRQKNPTVLKAVNEKFTDETPLYISAKTGGVAAAKIFFNLGANLKLTCAPGWIDRSEYTPERCAQYYNHVELYEWLREMRYESNLMESLGDRNLKRAQRYLEDATQIARAKKKKIVEQMDAQGNTPLLLALTLSKNVEQEEADILLVLKGLIQLGANVAHESNQKENLMQLAIERGCALIFNYLVHDLHQNPPEELDNIPTIFKVFKSGQLALLEAFAALSTTDFSLLITGGNSNLFHECASKNEERAVTAIANGLATLKKPNPTLKMAMEQRDDEDLTPLHVASQMGFLPIVEVYCSKFGADWTLESQGHTPEQIAENSRRKPVFEYLRKLRHQKSLLDCISEGFFEQAHEFHIGPMKKKKIERRQMRERLCENDPISGNTPLLSLVSSKLKGQKNEEELLRIAQELVALGADPNETNNAGENALLLAFECGYKTIFKFLLQLSKIDLWKLDGNNNVILHKIASCEAAKCDFVNMLLDKDNRLKDARNNDKQTPLFAVTDAKVLSLFLHAGANVEMKDKHGKGVEIYFVAQPQREGLLKMLKKYKPDINVDELLKDTRTVGGHIVTVGSNAVHTVLDTVDAVVTNTLGFVSGITGAAKDKGKDAVNTAFDVAKKKMDNL